MTRLTVSELTAVAGAHPLLCGVTLEVAAGEVLALAGSSGSGKSLTAHAVLGLTDPGLRLGGHIAMDGMALPLRGHRCGMGLVMQQPRRALNPLRRVGAQVGDALAAPSRGAALALLERVRFPQDRARAYPFELSGGLCQRVALAVALAGRPRLLIADEPTTDLDPPTQAALLDLLRDLAGQDDLAVLWITHDLAAAARWGDRIAVMEAGRIVGTARAAPAQFNLPPARATAPAPVLGDVVLMAEGVSKSFPMTARVLARAPPRPALIAASLTLRAGEALGVIGPSGSGKTTLARLLARLDVPDAGRVVLKGQALHLSSAAFARTPARREVQMVFQDAAGTLNPRFTAAQSIADPLQALCGPLSRDAVMRRVREAAEAVRLPGALLERRPHLLSGGQRARVGLARALVVEPCVLILDEPTSAFDAALTEEILALLDRLRRTRGMGIVIVTHDMGVVARLCDRAMVLSEGRVVEEGPLARLLDHPSHPVTRALTAAAPTLR